MIKKLIIKYVIATTIVKFTRVENGANLLKSNNTPQL
jgi:hypothetical protein